MLGTGRYILTITARRKNAKRHIVCRSNDLEELRSRFRNEHYRLEIWDSKWNLVELLQK